VILYHSPGASAPRNAFRQSPCFPAARSAVWGAVFTGVLWEASKHLFTWHVLSFGSYSNVYGSLSAAAVVLVWTYSSAAVALLGAEGTALLEARGNV